MVTPEGKVKKAVIKMLDEYPHYRFMPVQFGYGKRTLDFLTCYKGKFLAIETKAPDEEPTTQQTNIIREILSAGGTVLVIDGDLNLLRQWLEKNK